jgi:transcriptional regulator with XRE-family HTH domain
MSGFPGKSRLSRLQGQEDIDLARVDFLYDPRMELKDWIRAARVKAELTQEKLGELLGVSKGNVSAWENDRHEPSYAQLQQISEIAGMALPVTEHKHESGMRDASISVAKEGLFKGIPTDAKHSIDGSNITPGRGFHGKIPLISWDQARTWDQLVKNFAHDDALA